VGSIGIQRQPFCCGSNGSSESTGDEDQRPGAQNWKLQLVRGLYDRSYNRSQILDLFKFIDWIIVLPEGLSESFWNDLKTYEEERKMTYVTSVEKIGFKRGEQETRKEIALKLLGKGMSVEDVASATELSINQVQELQAQ
jgi:predicted transposase/invertase (TIGR01784 family)